MEELLSRINQISNIINTLKCEVDELRHSLSTQKIKTDVQFDEISFNTMIITEDSVTLTNE